MYNFVVYKKKNFNEIQKDLDVLFDKKINNPVYYHNITGAFAGKYCIILFNIDKKK